MSQTIPPTQMRICTIILLSDVMLGEAYNAGGNVELCCGLLQ